MMVGECNGSKFEIKQNISCSGDKHTIIRRSWVYGVYMAALPHGVGENDRAVALTAPNFQDSRAGSDLPERDQV